MSTILFYSAACPHSNRFLLLLDKLNVRPHFKLISVDKVNGRRPQVVTTFGIKEVPTVVSRNQKISGEAAFTWLHNALNEFSKIQGKAVSRIGTAGFGGGFGGRGSQQSAAAPIMSTTTLETLDMGGLGGTAGGGGVLDFSGPGFCNLNGWSGVDDGNYVTAGSCPTITGSAGSGTIDTRNFVKPASNFQLPNFMPSQEVNMAAAGAYGYGTGSGGGSGGKGSDKRTQMDYNQMMDERKRQDNMRPPSRR